MPRFPNQDTTPNLTLWREPTIFNDMKWKATHPLPSELKCYAVLRPVKIVRSIVCLTFILLTLAAYAAEDFPFPIHQRVSGYEITNTWFVAMSRLEKLPRWDEQGEPPLPVGKAVSLAKAWVISKGFNTNCYVGSIEFRSVSRGEPPVSPNKHSSPSKLRPCWFYIIHFEEVAMVGSWVTCVVLSDGSIVEPESSPDVKSQLHYLD